MKSLHRRYGPALILSLLIPFLLSGTIDRTQVRENGDVLEAIRKAALAGGSFDKQVERALPAVKAADEKALDQAREKLAEIYVRDREEGRGEDGTKTAHWICILAVAAKQAGKRKTHGECRLILWQEVCDLAASVLPNEEEAATLARDWEPLWEDLFLAVMADFSTHEGKGDEEGKARCLDQLALIAEAEKRAFNREDLEKKLTLFKEELRKVETLTPDQKKTKKAAESSLALAKARIEEKSFGLARDTLTQNAIPFFEKIGDRRGLMRAHFLRARAFEGLGEHGSIREDLDKALAMAAEMGDEGFAVRCRDYETRRWRENSGPPSAGSRRPVHCPRPSTTPTSGPPSSSSGKRTRPRAS
jgi:hypothetical protein